MKRRAQQAPGDRFKDEDDEAEMLKRSAQQALHDTLKHEDDNVEMIKRRGQQALHDTLRDEDDDVEKMMKQRAQQALHEVTEATMDAGSLKELKQAAKRQLEESLLAEPALDKALESDEDEQTKQEAQEAVEASMGVGSLENVKQEARRELEESLSCCSEAQAKLMAQFAVQEASEARSGASKNMTHTRDSLDSRALRRKAAVALVAAQRQGLMAKVLRSKAQHEVDEALDTAFREVSDGTDKPEARQVLDMALDA